MPIQLATPPAFTIELNPSLDIAYTPNDRLQRWIVRLQATGKVDVGLKATAAFEGQASCRGDPLHHPDSDERAALLLRRRAPARQGRFELGGKMTVATLEIGAEATAPATGRLGILCTAPAACTVDRGLQGAELHPQAANRRPRAREDLRLEPSIEVSIFVEGAMRVARS